ncbi:hypothetical protein DL98DRAFT_527124 [Cadophora sp. DSE1049]|nr:hypothetical protein DL98DRAFT_527124 [Cadophora sp. DSE1049]
MSLDFWALAIITMLTQTVSVINDSAILQARDEPDYYLWVNNWCSDIWEHQDDGCALRAGSTFDEGQPMAFHWEADVAWEHSPRALIISRPTDPEGTHVLFKYGLSYEEGHLRWSITTGAAFAGENVRVTPSGPNYGLGDCTIVRCYKTDKDFCTDGLGTEDPKPHMCENYMQHMWIDLCMPDGNFISNPVLSRCVT